MFNEIKLTLEVVLEVRFAVDEGERARNQGGEEISAEDYAINFRPHGKCHHLLIEMSPSMEVTGIKDFHKRISFPLFSQGD